MEFLSKPIISAKEARKLLGRSAGELSDTQVEEIVTLLTLLSQRQLYYNGSKKRLGIKHAK